MNDHSQTEAFPPLFERSSRDEVWEQQTRKQAEFLKKFKGGTLLVGDSLAKFWPKTLQQERFGQSFINLGVPGDRVENILWRLDVHNIKDLAPERIIVIAGTNNLKTDVKPETILCRLLALIDSLKTSVPKAALFLSEIPPRGDEMKYRSDDIIYLNKNLGQISHQRGFELVRIHASIMERYNASPDDFDLYIDKLHFGDKGYELFSDALQEII
ncbi:hypothetical protein ASG25_13530 [Rhizobium sp. Leaf384]|uniref:GDSL-type esterase/lipase family protein n=1 Tax=unclassified Rhizobium TaxID=2613769 RepID=UPI000714EDED|nr:MULTISPECIES: GDSL-type esterase/lipase family protein [unclassified Rhizobium]KQS77622.1 hypothetical protein ASG25_13530 [Rhizobium sp. Leaf384]KQS83742.1 hypothetical protein ASG58_21965 [Rhizobium sp. Leaf383]